MQIEPMATFVLFDWLVDVNSPRVREDIAVGIFVVINGSVALEIFESGFRPLEPTWDEDAVATTKLPPRVGFRWYLLLRRSKGALRSFVPRHSGQIIITGRSHSVK